MRSRQRRSVILLVRVEGQVDDIALRSSWLDGLAGLRQRRRQLALDPSLVLFVVRVQYKHFDLVLALVVSAGGGLRRRKSRLRRWRLRSRGYRMCSLPLVGAVLVVCRVPLPVSFHYNILYAIWCRLENVVEVSGGKRAVRQVTTLHYGGNLPVYYELLRVQLTLAYRTQPRCRLLHD